MVRTPAGDMERGAGRARPVIAFWETGAAMLLGFAEATFLFLLPETFVTFVAMQKGRLRAALLLALVAAVGGLLGGWMLHAWGAGASPKVVVGFLDAMPGVSREMIGEAFNALRLQGAGALFSAPLLEAPYRVHAALAAQAGVPATSFLMASAAFLALRFAAAAMLAHGLTLVWRRLVPSVNVFWIWSAAWLGIYGLWFTFLPD